MFKRERRFKKIGVLFLCIAVFITLFSTEINVLAVENFDYSTAFKNSIIFYDANKCGKEVTANNAFSWRRAPSMSPACCKRRSSHGSRPAFSLQPRLPSPTRLLT